MVVVALGIGELSTEDGNAVATLNGEGDVLGRVGEVLTTPVEVA